MMYSALKSLLLVLGLAAPLAVWSEPVEQGVEVEELATEAQPEADRDELAGLSAKLDAGIAEVKAIEDKLDSVSEADKEAMLFRRDQRSFGLMKDLDQLARKASELPEDDPQRIEISRQLAEDFAGVPALLFARMEEFGVRIASFQQELVKLR